MAVWRHHHTLVTCWKFSSPKIPAICLSESTQKRPFYDVFVDSLAQVWANSGPRAKCGPPQRLQWPAEAFTKNLQIWNFLPFMAVNISAEAMTEICFYFHKKVWPPLDAAFSKLPSRQIKYPPCSNATGRQVMAEIDSKDKMFWITRSLKTIRLKIFYCACNCLETELPHIGMARP